jgi:hypothetical protein
MHSSMRPQLLLVSQVARIMMSMAENLSTVKQQALSAVVADADWDAIGPHFDQESCANYSWDCHDGANDSSGE